MLDYFISLDYVNIISNIMLIIGAFFILTGAIGMFRFKDFYSRIHASGIIDSCGLIIFLIGLIMHHGFGLITFKIIILIIFSMYACASSTHILAKTAMLSELEMKSKIFNKANK